MSLQGQCVLCIYEMYSYKFNFCFTFVIGCISLFPPLEVVATLESEDQKCFISLLFRLQKCDDQHFCVIQFSLSRDL